MRVRVVRVTPLRQNCTLLEFENTPFTLVFDPGGDVPDLLTALRGRHVAAILLTHGHFDHVGAADALREALIKQQAGDVPLYGPDERDQFLLSKVERHAAVYGINGLHSAHPTAYVTHGETLVFSETALRVAHLPGHTPGHVVYICEAHRHVIAGDTLFRGVVGRTDTDYGNHELLLDGIRRELMSLPDDFIVHPGHGLPTTIGDERRHNSFLSNARDFECG